MTFSLLHIHFLQYLYIRKLFSELFSSASFFFCGHLYITLDTSIHFTYISFVAHLLGFYRLFCKHELHWHPESKVKMKLSSRIITLHAEGIWVAHTIDTLFFLNNSMSVLHSREFSGHVEYIFKTHPVCSRVTLLTSLGQPRINMIWFVSNILWNAPWRFIFVPVLRNIHGSQETSSILYP